MNSLLTILALPAILAEDSPIWKGQGKGWLLFGLFYLPQALGNLTFQLPLIPRYCYLTVSNRTDYYLFNSPVQIYTEGSVGMRLFAGSFGAEVRYVWPITRGYLEDRRPYIGLNFYLAEWIQESDSLRHQ